MKICVITFLVIVLLSPLSKVFGEGEDTNQIRFLLVNSYHRSYAWTDSINAGMLSKLYSYPEAKLFSVDLDTKNFGGTRFEIDKSYIKNKFSGVSFNGVFVTDNDALDFAVKYRNELFPKAVIVFAGISNPQDYKLDSLELYGFEESANSDLMFYQVKNILPNARRIFVIVDNSTTGKVYKKEFKKIEQKNKEVSVDFPDSTNLATVYTMDYKKLGYDAVFYTGITQSASGTFVDPLVEIRKLGPNVNVPLFSNSPQYIGSGIVGGIYQRGFEQGKKMVDLMMLLIDEKSDKSKVMHINYTEFVDFFDFQMLKKYSIKVKDLPAGAALYNKNQIAGKKYYRIFIGIVATLLLAVLALLVINFRRKLAQQKSNLYIVEIERQKKELEEAHSKLSTAIKELETTNFELIGAKKKAEESDKLKSAFLANVSHEIRTPLNSIVGFSSLLSEEDLDSETRKTYAELVESNTESLLVLIDEIIDLSKIEAQQLSIKKQDFSVDALIGELFQMFLINQQNDEVKLSVSKISPEMELFAYSDRVRVRQIFINLLSNAFKFTDHGFIEFGYFESKPKQIVLYVKDSGIGIAKENHHAIFQRFRKLNEGKNKRVYRGTGLGLAITQKLVELLGGRIWIESESGVGSTFFFTLKNLELKTKA